MAAAIGSGSSWHAQLWARELTCCEAPSVALCSALSECPEGAACSLPLVSVGNPVLFAGVKVTVCVSGCVTVGFQHPLGKLCLGVGHN